VKLHEHEQNGSLIAGPETTAFNIMKESWPDVRRAGFSVVKAVLLGC
jgi:hypothetical protein